MNTDTMFLRLLDGRTVAYAENDVRGELIDEYSRVERLQHTYDAVRDLALSPAVTARPPNGPALVFEARAWSSFVTTVKDGGLPA